MKKRLLACMLSVVMAVSAVSLPQMPDLSGMAKVNAAGENEDLKPQKVKFSTKNGDIVVTFIDKRDVGGYSLTLKSTGGERTVDVDKVGSDKIRFTLYNGMDFQGRKIKASVRTYTRDEYGIATYNDDAQMIGSFVAAPEIPALSVDVDLKSIHRLYFYEATGASGYQLKYKLGKKTKTINLKKNETTIDIPAKAKGVKIRAYKKYKGKKIYSGYCKVK